MPELPDVEIFREEAEKAKNSGMESFEIYDKEFIGISKNEFSKKLKGEKFKKATRRGKYLFLSTSKEKAVVMHFGMTGDLKYLKESEDAPEYAKYSFGFKNKHKLHYISKRKLGHVEFTDNLRDFIEDKELGPDVLEINEKEFVSLLKDKKSMIKTTLMDQSTISGIGNLYADEILFQCKIHPKQKITDLSDSDFKSLYKNIRKVLEKAIEKEADPSKLPKSYLLQNRKEGYDCPKCKGKIKKIKISGRSGYYCPSCQKKQ